MKLPEGLLQDESLGFSADPSPFDRDRYEAIVRDCAKVAAGSRQAIMATSFSISNAILARYGLEPSHDHDL